jgi:hypothetical protein
MENDARAAVEEACLSFIRLGDESRIPEMADLLERFGSIQLAEDYLNCGQPDLRNAARAWATSRGYELSTGVGPVRARWGSGK